MDDVTKTDDTTTVPLEETANEAAVATDAAEAETVSEMPAKDTAEEAEDESEAHSL